MSLSRTVARGSPPIAPPPEGVDQREIYRKLREEAAAGIPWWRVTGRGALRRQDKEEARRRADAERVLRAASVDELQDSLDAKWLELEAAAEAVDRDLESWLGDETARCRQIQLARQQELDLSWDRLCANEPDAVASALGTAFNDAGAVHVAGVFDGGAALIVEMPDLEDVVADQEPAYTSTGRLTVQARSKTTRNHLYKAAMASRMLRVTKMAFAAAPNLQVVCCVVIRPNAIGEMAPVYVGTFALADLQPYEGTSDPDRLIDLLDVPDDSAMNLRGRTHEIGDLALDGRPGLQAVCRWYELARGRADHEVAAELLGREAPSPEEHDPARAGAEQPEFPKRVTMAWLEATVPEMSAEPLERLLELLASRGWTEEEIEQRVLALRDDSISESGLGARSPKPVPPDKDGGEQSSERIMTRMARPSDQASSADDTAEESAWQGDVTAFINLGEHLDRAMLPMIEAHLNDPEPIIRQRALDYRERLLT